MGWWAQANGEEVVLPDGKKFCPVKGSLIRFHEWYGSPEVGTNTGLKLGSDVVARGILEREAALTAAGWISDVVRPGPADNSICTKDDDATDSIGKIMKGLGVEWTPSDKSPGSRINGLQLVRDRLANAVKREGPAIYFMSHCASCTTTLPVLPRDSRNIEDVDSDAEDHAYDEVRYRVLADAKAMATSVKVRYQT